MLLLHQCRIELAAGVGIAPTSAGLQPAAHLSEPSSVRVEREYGEACSPYVSRDVAEPGENGEWSDDTLALHLKVVPRRGDAPRSASYQPAALLLSYRGNEMAEHQRIALWTPLQGAAVFGTVSSSMPDLLL